jgi:hypothetical protein
MQITIDKKHRYTVDGELVPSVSTILNYFLPPSGFYTPEGAELGHCRHDWYNFLLRKEKPKHPPHKDIIEAVKGFEKFLAEVKPEYISGEIPYFHHVLKYCGMPDAVLKINGRLSVTDFKPKTRNKRTRLQTALYYLMLRANGVMVVDRYEARFYNGIYRLEAHTDIQDMVRAEIMVNAFNEPEGKRKDALMKVALQAAEFYK